MTTPAAYLDPALHKRSGPSLQIAIVGAGLSGLAAARRLIEAGHQVVVLEATDQPGGRCRTMRKNGFLIDLGPEIAASSYDRYLSLVRYAGLEDAVVACSPIVSTLRGGRMIAIDTRSLVSIATTPILSWRAKIRLLIGVVRNRRLLRQADAYRLLDMAWHDAADENAESFAVAAFGREAADYLIDPLIRIVGGSHMHRISRLAVLGGISSWSGKLVSVLGGLQRVPIATAAKMDVRYGVRVNEVKEDDDGIALSYDDAEGSPSTLHFDRCIIASQFDVAASIWPALAAHNGAYISKLAYNRLLDIKLAYDAATISKSVVGQVPSLEDSDLLLFSLSHNKAPDRAPAGHSLFTLYTDDSVWTVYAGKSDDEVIAWARGHMERLHPEIAGHFQFGVVKRQPQVVNFADPGFYQRTDQMLRSIPSDSRIQLAGDIFGAGSMEAAVVWGERAADRLLAA